MNIEFALWAVFVAFWCFGFMNAFQDGEIFGSVGNYLRKSLPSWVVDPMFECQMCMASLHGTTWYFLAGYDTSVMWPLFVVSISGLNYVLSKLMPK